MHRASVKAAPEIHIDTDAVHAVHSVQNEPCSRADMTPKTRAIQRRGDSAETCHSEVGQVRPLVSCAASAASAERAVRMSNAWWKLGRSHHDLCIFCVPYKYFTEIA